MRENISFFFFLYLLFQSIAAISFNILTFVGGLPFLTLIHYMLCFYVSTLTINGMLIGDHIYELQWYQLKRNEQFIVQTMIIRAQKSFELKGLGVFVCSLETFSAVKLREKLLFEKIEFSSCNSRNIAYISIKSTKYHKIAKK